MESEGELLGQAVLRRVGTPLRDQLLGMSGGDVDLEVDPGPRAAQAGDLERDDDRIGDRGPRLESTRQWNHRDAVRPRRRRELAAGRGDDPPCAECAGGLVGGERLLGIARVARAQNRCVRSRPRRQPVVARQHDRSRGAIAEGGARKLTSDRRSAHPGDHQTAGRIVWLKARGLDAPEGVAQLVGQGEDVVRLPRSVDPFDRLSRQLQCRGQNVIAPVGSCTPGKIRAP